MGDAGTAKDTESLLTHSPAPQAGAPTRASTWLGLRTGVSEAGLDRPRLSHAHLRSSCNDLGIIPCIPPHSLPSSGGKERSLTGILDPGLRTATGSTSRPRLRTPRASAKGQRGSWICESGWWGREPSCAILDVSFQGCHCFKVSISSLRKPQSVLSSESGSVRLGELSSGEVATCGQSTRVKPRPHKQS